MAAIAVVSAIFATLASLSPVRMYLSKIDDDLIRMTDDVFLRMSVPRLAFGLAAILAGLHWRQTKPALAWALVVGAPIIVLAAHLLLLALA